MVENPQNHHINLPIDTVIHGDALEVLKSLPSNSISAIVTDPPCGISFMSRNWDDDKGGRDKWIKWLSDIMKEAKRCLLPGGHALVWSLPRQSHWTALALEDAGFQIRDNIYNLVSGDTALLNFLASLSEEQQNAFMQVLDQQREPSGILHINGAGFPKSLDISKAIDRMKGMQREIIGFKHHARDGDISHQAWATQDTNKNKRCYGDYPGYEIKMLETKPATPESAAWQGWHSALKPSVENWWLVRKPLAASSIAENVLTYGTGGLNIDASRISSGITEKDKRNMEVSSRGDQKEHHLYDISISKAQETIAYHSSGRFPSHLLLTHHPSCRQVGTKRVQANGPAHKENETKAYSPFFDGLQINSTIAYRDEDGMETVQAWECHEQCPVRILDLQSGARRSAYPGNQERANAHAGKEYGYVANNKVYGTRMAQAGQDYSDRGGASRYFKQLPALDDVPPYIYAGKASRRDRNAGCEDLPEAYNDFQRESSGLSRSSNDKDGSKGTRSNPQANHHPTVKNTMLMKYLCRMICPPNGIVLDCFAGSGSTLVAAIHEGFHFIGIEKELEYVTIAQKRIEHAMSVVNQNQQNSITTPINIKSAPSTIKSTTNRKTKRKTQDAQQISLWSEEAI